MFNNPALAWGAAAFVIPLIIHILNRSRFRTIEWGAMHLLESVIKVNHRRFHVEQIILLLIRCAIPALLAFCLARPYLTGSLPLQGDAPVSLVILLDTSYSMDAVGASGSRFERAVDAACAIVQATSKGSEVAVIRTGGSPTPLFDQPVLDPAAVIRRLRQLQAGYGASDMQAALDLGLETLTGMSNLQRELIVISDFQPADWNAVSSDTGRSFRQQIDAMPIKPTLSLLSVGAPVSGNISVDSLNYPNRALGVGQQIGVRADLRNHGAAARDNARVILRIDGVEHSVAQVALAANGNSQAFFPCTFDTPGSHVMEVEVVTDDPLVDDNRLAAAVTIWDSVNVLLVDGDPSSQPLQSETDYLSIALTPYTFGRVRLSDLVETQTVAVSDLSEEKLQAARVIVLANVSQLSDAQLAALSASVQNGAALLVCAGNRIDLNWYREQMYANGAGLLPVPFSVLRGQVDNTGQSARIVAQHFDHPALEFFNEPSNGDLSSAEIRQWFQLAVETPGSGSEDDSSDSGSRRSNTAVAEISSHDEGAFVIARLDNGDALMVERRVGDGVVVQWATACDADWSDLPLRPFFVPLMQQLVTTMAAQISPPRNITTGAPAVVLFRSERVGLSDQAAAEPVASRSGDLPSAPRSLSVLTPDGSRRTVTSLPQGNRQLARFDGTQRPGVYTMTLPSAETIHFVATTSRDESDLSMLDEPALTSLADNLTAAVVASPAQYLEQDKLRRHGQEIWKYVLAALLAFMFLEVVLQQRFARVRA